MYCFTCVNGLNCVINELILWSDISSEHPTFIKTVAGLTNKNLPLDIVSGLDEMSRNFSNIKNDAMRMRRAVQASPTPMAAGMPGLLELINRFLTYDKNALETISNTKQVGKEDKVWQTLLEHISDEQTFMYETFSGMINQIM